MCSTSVQYSPSTSFMPSGQAAGLSGATATGSGATAASLYSPPSAASASVGSPASRSAAGGSGTVGAGGVGLGGGPSPAPGGVPVQAAMRAVEMPKAAKKRETGRLRMREAIAGRPGERTHSRAWGIDGERGERHP
ncbi:MAG: hypothetical protein R3F14_41000 [Polyangiaceae bacterium]